MGLIKKSVSIYNRQSQYARTLTCDVVAAMLVALVTLVVFGYRFSEMGLYADDPVFLKGIFLGMTMKDLFVESYSYVPGRNLHMIWQYFITLLAGGSAVHNIPAMHLIQTLADALTVSTLFVFFRIIGVQRWIAFSSSALFALFPNHGETHFWLSALPMNVFSTYFVILLLIASALIHRAFTEKNQYAIVFLVPVYSLTFVCAIFTYDQVVPVVMVMMTGLCLVLTRQTPNNWLKISVFWVVGVALFCVIIAWKISQSGSGPTLGLASLRQVGLNVFASLGIWTFVWFKDFFFATWRLASGFEMGLTFLLTATVLCAGSFFMRCRSIENTIYINRSASISISSPRSLFVLGAGFFVLTYIPVYIWHIASRHNYLPSVGIAIIIASVLTFIDGHIRKSLGTRVLLATISAYFIQGFILLNIVEKNFWIESYQFRKLVYQTVAESKKNTDQACLLMSKFPSSLYDIPYLRFGQQEYRKIAEKLFGPIAPSLSFLHQEQPAAASLMTQGNFNPKHLSVHPVPSGAGYFIQTEKRWGDNFLVHVENRNVIAVRFNGLDLQRRFKFIVDDGQAAINENDFYSVRAQISETPVHDATFAVRASGKVYKLWIPPIKLNSGERLALVGYANSGGSVLPAFFSFGEHDLEEFAIPIDVTNLIVDRLGRDLHLEYRVQMPQIDEFRLFVVTGEAKRLVVISPVQR